MNLFVLFIVFVFGICGAYLYRFSEKKIFWFFVAVFIILIGGRGLSVPDTKAYLEFYQQTLPFSILDIPLYSYEVGFQLFTKLLKIVTNGSSFLYFGVIVFVNSYLLFISFRNLRDVAYPKRTFPGKSYCKINLQEFLLLYFSYWGLYYNSIVLRAGIAISILIYISTLLCVPCISLKKWLIIFLLAIISCFFHVTAFLGIISLVVFYISKKLSMRSYMLLLFLVCMILFSKISVCIVGVLNRCMPVILSLIEDTDLAKLQAYGGDIDSSINISFRFLFCVFIGFFLIVVKNMPLYYYKYLNVYIGGLLLGALFSAIESFSRITDFFLIYSFILISMRLCIVSRLKMRSGIFSFIILMQFLFVYRIIIGL